MPAKNDGAARGEDAAKKKGKGKKNKAKENN
jgi:hypothetical protein